MQFYASGEVVGCGVLRLRHLPCRYSQGLETGCCRCEHWWYYWCGVNYINFVGTVTCTVSVVCVILIITGWPRVIRMSVTMIKRGVSSSIVLGSVFVVVVLWLLGKRFAVMFRVNGLVLLLDAWGSVYSQGEGGGSCRVLLYRVVGYTAQICYR